MEKGGEGKEGRTPPVFSNTPNLIFLEISLATTGHKSLGQTRKWNAELAACKADTNHDTTEAGPF